MTPEQYERWKDFSRRMVNVARSARHRSPSRADTLEIIESLFSTLDYGDEWARVENWDHTSKEEGDTNYPLSVSSLMSEMESEFVPCYWSLGDTAKGRATIDRWMSPAQCCVRAGLDVAVAPSGGVVGFTAGDIRKMFPDGVPDYVKSFFNDGELVAMTPTAVDGVFATQTVDDPRTFDDLPDDQGLWL